MCETATSMINPINYIDFSTLDGLNRLDRLVDSGVGAFTIVGGIMSLSLLPYAAADCLLLWTNDGRKGQDALALVRRD